MTLSAMDSNGRLHRTVGPGGGQYAAKPAVAPARSLTSDSDRLRARVRVAWRHLFDVAQPTTTIELPTFSRHRRDGAHAPRDAGPRSRAQTFITNVSIPSYTTAQAPVSVVVDHGALTSGADLAREYRSVDGRLFRQLWSTETSEGSEDIRANSARPVTERHWAPGVTVAHRPLRPVPADEGWLRAHAASTEFAASSEMDAAALLEASLHPYAAIDGEVWRESAAPAYRVPTITDAPFTGPAELSVVAAPDTTYAAADLGLYPSDQYDQAIAATRAFALEHGIPVAEAPAEPPIKLVWGGSLYAERQGWRPGHPIEVESSETLTEGTFRDRLAAFREQIVTIPGAVTGDVRSFLVVGDWRVDFSALTRQQQDEYRRHIVYGVEHGLI